MFLFYITRQKPKPTPKTLQKPETYVDINTDVTILPDVIPDDSRFNDRDFSDKDREDRFHKLIFG